MLIDWWVLWLNVDQLQVTLRYETTVIELNPHLGSAIHSTTCSAIHSTTAGTSHKAQPWSAYHEEQDLHFACAQKCHEGQHRWFRRNGCKCERETPRSEQCYLVPYLHLMLLDRFLSNFFVFWEPLAFLWGRNCCCPMMMWQSELQFNPKLRKRRQPSTKSFLAIHYPISCIPNVFNFVFLLLIRLKIGLKWPKQHRQWAKDHGVT